MKKMLVIGSAAADVTIRLSHLPSIEEDIEPQGQSVSLGGCAHNAAHIMNLMHVPFQLIAPVGTGMYGDFVRNALKEEGIPVWKNVKKENGCCYCLVDDEGNRTFLSVHGAEYDFQRDWLLEIEEGSWIYVCGIELEGNSGDALTDFLESRKEKVCFAPGPRLNGIRPDLMKRLLKRADLVHLNRREYQMVKDLGFGDLMDYDFDLVITNGGKDTIVKDNGKVTRIPSVSCKVIDGTGAGDAHIGAILSYLYLGETLTEAVRKANRISAAVCQHLGACISRHDFDEIEK